MMMALHYKSGNDNKSDNNEDKIWLLFKDDMVGYVLDYVLDYMIPNFVTTAIQLPSSLAWALINK